MKKSGIIYIFLSWLLITSVSCERILMSEDPENTPVNNFEILWNTLDKKYSFFITKAVDWDSIYQVYRPRILEDMQDTLLFQTLGGMLLELKDGHTEITSPFGRINFNYAEGFKTNFAAHIITITYLGPSENKRDGILYSIIDSVGYMYIGNFTNEITDDGIRHILNHFADTRGIIIDVRNNAGGNDRYCGVIANHFFDQKRMVEINHFKTGPGHDDFGTIDHFIEPKNGLGIVKPTVILTNRGCYSACNTFVCWMSALPHVSIVGDTTGGGGGRPHFSELPNGWIYRYSATKSYRPDGLNIDEGIPPDHYVTLTKQDSANWKDTLIKYALELINQ